MFRRLSLRLFSSASKAATSQASFQAPATSASFPSREAKASTGLVGYPVDPDARQNLITDYNRVLKFMSKNIPESSAYRKNVTQTFEQRLSILQDRSRSDVQVEIDIGVAQLEELRAECDKELNNAIMMAEWKPWQKAA